MEKPLISIITSTYNEVKNIGNCINSIDKQINVRIEHIVIDGNSNDGTVKVIQENMKKDDSKISYFISEKDEGIYHAWNKGLSKINSDWVMFLGADDTLFNDTCLSKISSVLESCPKSINIVYGSLKIIENDMEQYIWSKIWDDFKTEFRKGVSLRHTAVFHRSSLFRKKGLFDDSFRIAGDSEFLLRELIKNDAVSCEICVANHFSGGVSSNIKFYARQLKEGLIIRKKYKLPSNIIIRYLTYVKYYIKIIILSILPIRISAYFLDFGRILQGKKAYWSK